MWITSEQKTALCAVGDDRKQTIYAIVSWRVARHSGPITPCSPTLARRCYTARDTAEYDILDGAPFWEAFAQMRCISGESNASWKQADIHRLPGATQVAEHSIGLLFNTAARIQVWFAWYSYGVVVYFGPRQDITPGKAGEGSITAEL